MALAVIAGTTMLAAIAAHSRSDLGQASVQGDTPEICGISLEQNPFMIKNFGHLREERFQPGESCAFPDPKHRGCTEGLYTYAVYGSQAEGVIKAVWIREPGANGSLYIISLQIVGRRPATMVVPSSPATPVERRGGPNAPGAPENPNDEA